MAEYIEREAAIESFRKNLDGGYVLTNDAQTTHILQSIPAADVRPVEWIPVTERLPVGGDESGAVCENVCLMMDDGTVSCGWMNGITKKV